MHKKDSKPHGPNQKTGKGPQIHAGGPETRKQKPLPPVKKGFGFGDLDEDFTDADALLWDPSEQDDAAELLGIWDSDDDDSWEA